MKAWPLIDLDKAFAANDDGSLKTWAHVRPRAVLWGEYKYHGNPYIQGTTVPCDNRHTIIVEQKINQLNINFCIVLTIQY